MLDGMYYRIICGPLPCGGIPRASILGHERIVHFLSELLELLLAATLLLVLQPMAQVGCSAQALATELLTALLHAAPSPIAAPAPMMTMSYDFNEKI